MAVHPFALRTCFRFELQEASHFRINVLNHGILAVNPAKQIHLSTAVAAEWKVRLTGSIARELLFTDRAAMGFDHDGNFQSMN